MHKLFLLIYCQPLRRILFWMLLLAFLWGYLGYREKNSLRWRLCNCLVFLGVAAAIFYMTVYTRGESPNEAVLVPFQSFQEARIQPELYRSMLMNVFLFVPLGLSLPFVVGNRYFSGILTVLTALAFSAGIEYMQYRYALGWCEVDDVIMNTLGALFGCLGYWLYLHWEQQVIPGFRFLRELGIQMWKKLNN